MTTDELVELALGRASEVTKTYPGARGPMYRRIGYRQRWLYARAARINEERFGICAVSALQTDVDGRRVVDLSDVDGVTVPTPESISRIEIHNAGTSPYAVGDKVHVVSTRDANAEDAPRCYVRDRLIIGVGTDLALVTSLDIYYPRLPALLTETDLGTTALELVAPYDTLLEVDLAKWLIEKATQVDDKIRAAAIAGFAAEETGLLADFDAHVAEYAPVVSQFARHRSPPGA